MERERILAEYARRERTIPAGRYDEDSPVEVSFRSSRLRTAEKLLAQAAIKPTSASACLEIGYGRGGWIPDLINWGVPEFRIHGIELDEVRVSEAQSEYPKADLRVGDASDMPWNDRSFDFAVISTVFSSILDDEVRRLVAAEATRVLRDGGFILWYDLRVDNRSIHQ